MIIVSLIGLKKSGKTTTAEALISEFKRRGMKVAAVKSMTLSRFTVDTEGKDTWRHRKAGADIVVSLSADEIAFIEGRREPPTLKDALGMLPGDVDILICEGITDDGPGILRIALAKEPSLLKDTFEVRGIKDDVIAISGIMANGVREHPDYPVYNCLNKGEVSALADLILEEHSKRSDRSDDQGLKRAQTGSPSKDASR
jgi:molybdopterin-guanine dinucleotide biosynthesis protein B